MKYFLVKIKDFIKITHRNFLILGIAIVFFALIFQLGGFIFSQFSKERIKVVPGEILAIKATSNLDEQIKLYKALIERVGPAEAQDDLYKSGLPFTGQTHLLNHIVGDYLYEKYGPVGLVQCKEYFLSSCYHGFILHVIGDGGMAKVEDTFNECYKFGSAVYTQCAHAIGHGFLANIGYENLPLALSTCDEAAEKIKNFPVYNCHDGVFMENIWAVHDGAPSPARWVNEKDLLYPCNSKRIEEKYINACWSNQPSLIYQLTKGDLKKVASICFNIENSQYQQTCFNGLARKIHPLARGSVVDTQALCGFMPTTRWSDFCIATNAVSSFSVGDRVVSFEICANIREEGKKDCYNRLMGIMNVYIKDKKEFKSLCSKIKDKTWRKACEIKKS